MKKRCILLWLVALVITIAAAPVSASKDIRFDTPITLTVNDTLIQMDTEPFLYRGTTFVPIRFVSQALGAETIDWNPSTQTATICRNGTTIRLKKGEKVGFVNGKYISIDNGIQLVHDRLFVPVRFISESLGCRVDWQYDTYTVNVIKEGIKVPEDLVGIRNYTNDEIYWLSRIIHAESRGEPMAGKIAVGNVVLNRVSSKDYPNTIYGVIFDRKNGTQFSPVLDGSIYQKPYGDSIVAAKRALRGENQVAGCLFFLNPKTAQNYWIMNHRTYYKTIANHQFYL